MSRADKYFEPIGDPFGGPAYGRREDPVTMTVLVVAAASVSAIGAIQQGQAAKAAARYNAVISTQNAQIARSEAQTLAEQQDRENYMRLGTIRANQGKSGGASEGSVLDVIGDAASQGEFQKQQIKYGGELKARDFTNSSILDNARARQAQTASYFQASADLLQGGSTAYSNSLLRRSAGPTTSTSSNVSW